jgi:regulator of protease activity HflC (stomatin/prohibitin superfamily)
VHSRAALQRGDGDAARAHARRSVAAGGALAVVDAAAWRQLQAATGILHLVAPGRGWR